MVDINEYLDVLPRINVSDTIGKTKMNNILLNSMLNGWSNQDYVQDINCETDIFKILKHIWMHESF